MLKYLSFIRIGVLCAICSILSACGSTSQPRLSAPINVPVVEEQVPQQSSLNLADVFTHIDAGQMNIANLLEDAKTFIAQQDFKQARAILYALAPEISAQDQDTFMALVALSLPPQESVVDDAYLKTSFTEPALEVRRLTILQNYYLQRQRLLDYASITATLHADDIDQHHQLLQQLAVLNDKQLNTAQRQYPQLQPHLALLTITRETGNDVQALATALEQFQQVYFGHPLAQNLPPNILQAATSQLDNLNELAVLLPLSGRFASTGNTIKQGVLSAYFDLQQTSSSPINLRIIDTASIEANEVVAQASSASWVIGPLLKENIDNIIPFLPLSVKRLALNRVDDSKRNELALTLADTQTAYFGLAPEDEAIQLANHVFDEGYRHPIVVAPDLGVGQRMLQAFTNHWQSLQVNVQNNQTVAFDTVQFDTIDNLGDALADALGVSQSNDNISQINRMTNRILYDQTRSRQDIDAIVVFASPEQISLINPMVEASISPFRQQVVPVYATSRSFDRTDAPNQLRDLENVRFLDAPFVLQGEKWPEQTRIVKALWPEQRAAFARLFAFGYDAVAMLEQIRPMGLLPAYRYTGMSGELWLNRNAEIQRRLPMAKIEQQSIRSINTE